jgi:hypothetical protein
VSEIRSWAVGALAVAAIAVGAGAGVQIARTGDVPVAPVVAAVPAAPAVTLRFTVVPDAVAPLIRSPRASGAGSRPEIGTPLRADWAMVCGESALSSGFASLGAAGVVGRSAGGV